MQEYFCKLIVSGVGSREGSGQILIILSPISNLALAVKENPNSTLVNLGFSRQNQGGSSEFGAHYHA